LVEEGIKGTEEEKKGEGAEIGEVGAEAAAEEKRTRGGEGTGARAGVEAETGEGKEEVGAERETERIKREDKRKRKGK